MLRGCLEGLRVECDEPLIKIFFQFIHSLCAPLRIGNPGKKFVNTRHNAGFDVVDRLAAAEGIALSSGPGRTRAKLGGGAIAGVPVILAKPQTYMNLSGKTASIFHLVIYV